MPAGGPFWHVGLVVADLDAAMAELSGALDLRWVEPQVSDYGAFTIRVSFSRGDPPYIELIEGGPGGPWDVSGGPRFDHLGYWSHDVAADSHHLESVGLPLEVDSSTLGRPGLFCYHRSTTTGIRLEVLQRSEGLVKLVESTLRDIDGPT